MKLCVEKGLNFDPVSRDNSVVVVSELWAGRLGFDSL
jgi:hypothetical protein